MCFLPVNLLTLGPRYLDAGTVQVSVLFQSLPVELFLLFCKYPSNNLFLLLGVNLLFLYSPLFPLVPDSQPGDMAQRVNTAQNVQATEWLCGVGLTTNSRIQNGKNSSLQGRYVNPVTWNTCSVRSGSIEQRRGSINVSWYSENRIRKYSVNSKVQHELLYPIFPGQRELIFLFPLQVLSWCCFLLLSLNLCPKSMLEPRQFACFS